MLRFISPLVMHGGEVVASFPIPYRFFFLLFSPPKDWPGEAGTVQEGHRAPGPADKAGDADEPVLGQQAAH